MVLIGIKALIISSVLLACGTRGGSYTSRCHGMFSCRTSYGSPRCTSLFYVCDGTWDCPYGDDENPENCYLNPGWSSREETTTLEEESTTEFEEETDSALPLSPVEEEDSELGNKTRGSINSFLLETLGFRSQLSLNILSQVVPELEGIQANITGLGQVEKDSKGYEERTNALEQELLTAGEKIENNKEFFKRGRILHERVRAELRRIPVEFQSILKTQKRKMSP